MIFFAEFPVRQILKLFAGLFREKFASEGAKCAFGRYKMAKISHKEPKRLYPRNNRQAGVLDQFVANIIKAPQKVQATQPCNKHRKPSLSVGLAESL